MIIGMNPLWYYQMRIPFQQLKIDAAVPTMDIILVKKIYQWRIANDSKNTNSNESSWTQQGDDIINKAKSNKSGHLLDLSCNVLNIAVETAFDQKKTLLGYVCAYE